nr:hypothetical protein [Lachnospiraceae bacterium]
MNEDKRNEKLGRAAVGVMWFLFAAKFLIVATLIALVALYFLHKPLWIAPLIAIGVFALYRLFWR